MKIGKGMLAGSKNDPNQKTKKQQKRRKWLAVAVALYITFLLLSTIPFVADRVVEPSMKNSYDYHLRYPCDGRQTHYYVERVDTNEIGQIDLTYTTSSNTLDVDVKNLKVLHIFCRSMYEDECKKVYGIDPNDNSNYFKWYFIEKNHLNVNINSDEKIEDLRFIDTPIPYEVFVNGIKWIEGEKYNYTSDFSTALSDVPSGDTRVDIYFKARSSAGIPPVAVLSASKTLVQINYSISFDATQSFDLDGTISSYLLDFGDGTFRGGSKQTYSFPKPGVYGVILTVRDNDYLIDHTYVNITVVTSSNIPQFQDTIPHQIKPEDSPPWTLNLSVYEPIATKMDVDFFWYLTGENTKLYTLTGENTSNSRFVFTPVPDAYGNDMVTIWLKSTENLTASQALWINITPVNDPPIISGLPDLIVHYNDAYTFNYLSYVNDKETPREKLILDVFDGYEEDYITIDGLNVTYDYPQKLVGEIIYVTITVSDGEDIAQDIITIQVTSDYVPKLVKALPDVWLFEGTTKYNVFDLDDYFMDPDSDAIFYSFGATHLDIKIKGNHSVDITSSSEWTGSELVTFRARDPMGALAEDLIVVTVIPVNDPPLIKNVPDFVIRYNHEYRFDLTPYVHDNDNETEELTLIPSDIDHIRLDDLNNMVIIINYPIDFLGETLPVRLTVTDGLDYSFQVIMITVTDDYPPELLQPLPDVVFLEDMPLINGLNLDDYFLDIDGDALYYTTGQRFVNITINSDLSVDFRSPQNWFGSEIVNFRATDPTGALKEDSITVTVLPVNDPPLINVIPVQYGNESERWMLDLTPFVYDVDNNISDLIIEINSDYVVVSGNELIFLGSREMPKTIELTVSDGQFSDNELIEVHIKLDKAPASATFWDLFINLLPFLILIILIVMIITGWIYRKKRQFTVEEVFLIHKGGTLINHLMRKSQANVDDVIFSGMFTAVQEFIKDTFSKDDGSGRDSDEEKWVLDELSLGENKIIIEQGENTYLAVIFNGPGSKPLRRLVGKILGTIETKYDDVLPFWEGDMRSVSGTKEILSALIKIDDKEKQYDVPKFEPIEPKVTPSVTPTTPSQSQQTPPITTSPITKAQPITKVQPRIPPTQPKNHIVTKNPKLFSWPMRKGKNVNNSQQGLVPVKGQLNKYPVALNITSFKSGPKTMAAQRLNVQPQQANKPVNLITPTTPKTYKGINLEAGKPLIHQIANINKMDNMNLRLRQNIK